MHHGVLQTVAISKAPGVASHSDVRALVDNTRNLSDRELDAIKANGGVVQVTPFNTYLVSPPSDYREKVQALRTQLGLTADFPAGPLGAFQGSDELPTERHQAYIHALAGLYPKATIADMIKSRSPRFGEAISSVYSAKWQLSRAGCGDLMTVAVRRRPCDSQVK